MRLSRLGLRMQKAEKGRIVSQKQLKWSVTLADGKLIALFSLPWCIR